jgi:hypothetical protein
MPIMLDPPERARPRRANFDARPGGAQELFEQQLTRLDRVAQMSIDSFAARHAAALRSEQQTLHTLIADAAKLREGLARVDSELKPDFERIEQVDARSRALTRWSKVPLVSGASAAQVAAARGLQAAFRRRRRASLPEHVHCPVLLRRNFVRGVPTRLGDHGFHPPRPDGWAVDDASPRGAAPKGGEEAAGRHFMSIL